MAEPDDNDAIESRIGLTVATAVEPMAVCLAGGSRYGTYTAQRGERGLGLEPFRVTPGCDQEVGCRVGSYAEYTDQGWRCSPGQSFELGLQVVDFCQATVLKVKMSARRVTGCWRAERARESAA